MDNPPVRDASRGRAPRTGMNARRVAGLAAAILLPIGATILGTQTSVGQFPSIPYFMSVLVAAALGRLVAGLVATALSVALLDYYFVGPSHGFGVDGEAAFALAAFAAVAIVVSEILARRDVAIEQARTARRRLELVSNASELLAQSLDYPAAFTRLAELVVGDFADICLIDVRSADGSIERVAAAHRDPAKQPLVDRLRDRYPPDPAGEHPVARVTRTGTPESRPVMSAAFLKATTRDDEHFRLTRELGFQSFMCVALEARGSILGAVTFVSCDPRRRYGPGDLDVAEELARRAALRLDNARLFTEEHLARAEAEERRQRMAVLATAGSRLAASLDYQATLSSVLDLAVAFYSEHAVVFLGRDPGAMTITATAHRDPAVGRRVEEVLRRYVPDAANPDSQIAEAVLTGRPVRIRPLTEEQMLEAGLSPKLIEANQQVQARSGVIVPLRGHEGVIGALSLTNSSEGVDMDADDVDFAVEFADRVAVALENASLYEAQRRVSHLLQQGLLPNSLPDIAGHEVAARYVAAGPASEVGGDFYDVIVLGPVATLIAVGDVCGRGPEAATVMGKARATLRALVRRIESPAALLCEVNDILLAESLDGRFVTAGIIRLEPGRARIALAGHPRPVLVAPDGAASLVGDHGPLLGIFDEVEFAETVVAVDPGAGLVTFTDGIETRRVHAEDRALEIIGANARGTAAELADAVAEAAAVGGTSGDGDQTDDDVAVVAIRRLR